MAQFDETFDWVVVGSGAGSMASALLMRRAGKSVLILEKADVVGGTTCKSGGVMWIPNNRFIAEDGETDSPEAAMTYPDALQNLDGGAAPGATPHTRRPRSEERRGGKEWVRKCRSRGSPIPIK